MKKSAKNSFSSVEIFLVLHISDLMDFSNSTYICPSINNTCYITILVVPERS